MLEEGSPEELANYLPIWSESNISFGIKDVPRLYQKVMQV